MTTTHPARAGLLLFLAACARPAGGTAVSTVVVPAVTAMPSASAAPAPKPPFVLPDVSPGDVAVEVMGLGTTEDGAVVVLGSESHPKVLPIVVGGTEALAIALRYQRRRFERPLTHDLLDSVMRDLGGQLVRVRIDDLRGEVFVATIFVRQGDRVDTLDARPSDAIALALGSRVPIYLAPEVLERAGVDRSTIRSAHDAAGGDAGVVVP